MKLIKSASQGEWFAYRQDGDDKLEARVRRIPPLKAKEIEIRHLGRTRKRTFHKGVSEFVTDVDKSEAVIFEKAEYALLELRGGWEFPAESVPAIQAIKVAVGDTEVQSGDYVTLDGHWSKPEVRAQAFAAYPALALWAVEKAGAQEVAAQEDEGKGESS